MSVKVASKVCASRLITKHFYVQELSYGKLNNEKNMVFVNIVNNLKDKLVKDKRFLVHEFKGNFEPFLSRLGNQSDKLFPVRWENLHGHTSLYFQKKKRQEKKSRNDWNVAGYNNKTFIRWQLIVN